MIRIMKIFITEYKKIFSLEKYIGEKNLHLGCGNNYLKNFINSDFRNQKHIDQAVDLNEPLPYESNSVDSIYSDNVFEHIKNQLELIRECHRVLKKDGVLIIKVPYFKSKHAFADPTHCNFYTVQSMDCFVKDTNFNKRSNYFDENFESFEVFLDPYDKSIVKKILGVCAVRRPNTFENSILSNIFVFHNIVYVLKK